MLAGERLCVSGARVMPDLTAVHGPSNEQTVCRQRLLQLDQVGRVRMRYHEARQPAADLLCVRDGGHRR